MIVICVRAWSCSRGAIAFDHAREAEILHDHRIHARRVEQAELPLGVRQFAGEDQRVERDVALHAVPVQELHEPRQILLGEIVRAQPGVESRQAEIDRVRAIGHRRARTVPVSRGGEKFGFRAAWNHKVAVARNPCGGILGFAWDRTF